MENCYERMINNYKRDGVIVYYDCKVSLRRFVRDIEGLCGGFKSLNLQKGDVVTVYLPTCPQSAAAFYACSKLGLIASFVHPVTPLDELEKYVKATGSKAVMFYDALVKDESKLAELGVELIRCRVSDYQKSLKPFFFIYANAGSKRLKRARNYIKFIDNNTQTETEGTETDVVCYMHSGGTSGEPKIVRLTNYAFNSVSQILLDMYHTPPTDNNFYLATLPIFHAFGLCVDVHSGLSGGYSLAMIPKFDPKVVCRYIKKYNTTVWSVVPAMLTKMLKSGLFDGKFLKKIDVIYCGGDTLSESMVETVDTILRKNGSRAKLLRGYGLTETCGVCTVNNYDFYRKRSCGKPIKGCKIRICDDNGNILPPNAIGEIVLTTDGLMSGYLEGGESWSEDGWLKTGDIGYLDEDNFLYVVDRKKRSVKIAAVNVFPSEVEECIASLPFIDEACVVPYRYNGKQYLKAFVTLKHSMDEQAVSKAVIGHCKANLIRYSVPSMVEVISQMPRTKLAKIDYKKLEEQ